MELNRIPIDPGLATSAAIVTDAGDVKVQGWSRFLERTQTVVYDGPYAGLGRMLTTFHHVCMIHV